MWPNCCWVWGIECSSYAVILETSSGRNYGGFEAPSRASMARPWRRLLKHRHTHSYPKDNKLNLAEGSCSLQVGSATENYLHISLNIICMKMIISLIMAKERRLKQNINPGKHKAPQSIPKCCTSHQENAYLRVKALQAAKCCCNGQWQNWMG